MATVNELKETLEEAGVAFDSKATKPELEK